MLLTFELNSPSSLPHDFLSTFHGAGKTHPPLGLPFSKHRVSPAALLPDQSQSFFPERRQHCALVSLQGIDDDPSPVVFMNQFDSVCTTGEEEAKERDSRS